MRLLSRSGDTKTRGKARARVRVLARWSRKVGRYGLGVLAVGAVVGGSWLAWQGGWIKSLPGAAIDATYRLTAAFGLRVSEVLVIGRGHTSRERVLAALDVRTGVPILNVNIDAARQRLLTIPWVREASIERALPDTLVVRLVESRPLAIWQYQGRFALIDDSGEIVPNHDRENPRELIVVVGEGAPAQAARLMEILRRQPDLMRRVDAAVWVGGRRWNVRLKGGIDIRLPESDAEAAWDRLAEYQRKHAVLDRDVSVLDLRFPDQLIVRRVGRPAEQTSAKDRDT